MLSLTPGALVQFGWNDRVVAMYNSIAEQVPSTEPPGLSPVRITRVERIACFAVGPDGSERMLRADPLPAVGDWALAGADVLGPVLPRWSELQRVDAAGAGLQTLAANVDIVAVVTPADRSSPARVERELALAWESGAVPLVVMTKADLDPGGVADALRRRLTAVDIVEVSIPDGSGISELGARIAPDRTAVLLGPSGAGKSTLTNALLGSDRLVTGAMRGVDARGRHTTTSRQLVALPSGGVLIDTPGIRSLGLPAEMDLSAGFSDVEGLARGCRFSDCAHEAEPGCAVLAALDSGELDPERLASFRKLTREVAWQQRRHDPLQAQEARRIWQAREKEARAARRERWRK